MFDHLASVIRATKPEIALATELTFAQVQRGFDHIRDVMAKTNEQPLVYDPRTHAYAFAMTALEVNEYRAYRTRICAKQLGRIVNGSVVPGWAKFGDREMQWVAVQLGRIQEDLERIAAR